MPPNSRDSVERLSVKVREVLLGLDQQLVASRPNSYEPTVAESVALALIELDRVGPDSDGLPTFAAEFLNRRLSRRLLERYSAAQLSSEFDRRTSAVLGRLDGSQRLLDGLTRVLSELESTLLQAQRSER